MTVLVPTLLTLTITESFKLHALTKYCVGGCFHDNKKISNSRVNICSVMLRGMENVTSTIRNWTAKACLMLH